MNTQSYAPITIIHRLAYADTDLSRLGCIVNLAGNPGLEQGPDVPDSEREALMEVFQATRGFQWHIKTYWGSTEPVCKWYKVRPTMNLLS